MVAHVVGIVVPFEESVVRLLRCNIDLSAIVWYGSKFLRVTYNTIMKQTVTKDIARHGEVKLRKQRILLNDKSRQNGRRLSFCLILFSLLLFMSTESLPVYGQDDEIGRSETVSVGNCVVLGVIVGCWLCGQDASLRFFLLFFQKM